MVDSVELILGRHVGHGASDDTVSMNELNDDASARRLRRVLRALLERERRLVCSAPVAADLPPARRLTLRPWAKDSPTPGSGATRAELRHAPKLSRCSCSEDLTSSANLKTLTTEDIAFFKEYG